MLYARQQWDVQNNAAHITSSNKGSYKHTRLILELKHLHTQKDNMLIEDRILFDHHQTNIDTMKTYQIQKLISTIALIVHQSKREAKKIRQKTAQDNNILPTPKTKITHISTNLQNLSSTTDPYPPLTPTGS